MRQHGQQVADQVAAGVAKKGAGFGEIIGQKTEQSAGDQEGHRRHQVLGGSAGGDQAEPGRADGPESGAKAVHVVHEIEGVDDGQNPQGRDGVAEDDVVNEEGDANTRCGDQPARPAIGRANFAAGCNSTLSSRKPISNMPKAPGGDAEELRGSAAQAVLEKPHRAGRGVEEGKDRSAEQGGQQAGHHGQPACQGNGGRHGFCEARDHPPRRGAGTNGAKTAASPPWPGPPPAWPKNIRLFDSLLPRRRQLVIQCAKLFHHCLD